MNYRTIKMRVKFKITVSWSKYDTKCTKSLMKDIWKLTENMAME